MQLYNIHLVNQMYMYYTQAYVYIILSCISSVSYSIYLYCDRNFTYSFKFPVEGQIGLLPSNKANSNSQPTPLWCHNP